MSQFGKKYAKNESRHSLGIHEHQPGLFLSICKPEIKIF